MAEQQIDSQDARLAALFEVSSQLGNTLDLAEVLNQVMDSIIQLTGAERGFLMMYDEISGELQPRAARNVGQETIEGAAMNISRTVIERSIASGEGVLTSNAQEDDRFSAQTSVVGYQLLSIMCAPLKAHGRTLGAVYVDNRLFSGVFSSEDLDLLVTFTNQAAMAIENARLFTQTDQALARRVEELSLFQRIDQQLNKSLELNRVLSLALNWAIALTNADGGSIGLFEEPEDEDGDRFLRLLVYRGEDENNDSRVLGLEHPVIKEMLTAQRSILTHNVSEAESIDGTPALVQLVVPIQQDGQMTGIITLETQHSTEMNREDITFVERLADRAAVAIKNARLYEAIQAANDAKSEFVSLVAHELRVPMTSIKGYTDLINSGMAGELNETQQQFVDVIRRNLDRMSRLITDLADINRVESGRMVFNLQPFELREIIADVTGSLSERVEARQQTMAVQVDEGVTAVYADPTRIGQVLTNLISNANKYTPDGGHVDVRVHGNDTHAIVAIADNGLGISDEDQEKLFTQFFRSEAHAVREQSGWGLGLSIVRKMIEAQNGEIVFESTLGEGSTFTFSIPLAPTNE